MIALVYKRPWLALLGINTFALFLVWIIGAGTTDNLHFARKALVIAPIGRSLFTLKQTWWWDDKNPWKALWLKRFMQTGVIWGVVFIILGFILLRMQ